MRPADARKSRAVGFIPGMDLPGNSEVPDIVRRDLRVRRIFLRLQVAVEMLPGLRGLLRRCGKGKKCDRRDNGEGASHPRHVSIFPVNFRQLAVKLEPAATRTDE